MNWPHSLALFASTLLVLIAAFHLFWGLGGRWPGKDRTDLCRKVMGGPPEMEAPGTRASWFIACLAVATVMLSAALVVLSTAGIIRPRLDVAPEIFPAICKMVGIVFLGRGVLGFLDGKLRPAIRGGPYARLNKRLYSPLALVIGAAVTLIAFRLLP